MVKGKMKKQKIKFAYDVPEPIGVKSTLTKNKQTLKRCQHTAKERRVLREWNECYENH